MKVFFSIILFLSGFVTGMAFIHNVHVRNSGKTTHNCRDCQDALAKLAEMLPAPISKEVFDPCGRAAGNSQAELLGMPTVED